MNKQLNEKALSFVSFALRYRCAVICCLFRQQHQRHYPRNSPSATLRDQSGTYLSIIEVHSEERFRIDGNWARGTVDKLQGSLASGWGCRRLTDGLKVFENVFKNLNIIPRVRIADMVDAITNLFPTTANGIIGLLNFIMDFRFNPFPSKAFPIDE